MSDFRDYWMSTEDDKTWTLHLDRYERDNLLFLLNSIGYPGGNAINPLHVFNNGDWVGQIALKLMRTDGSYKIDEKDRPNAGREQIEQYIQNIRPQE